MRQQVWIPSVGNPNVLDVRTEPIPTPGRGEVRIRTDAVGVNFADILIRRGLYPDAPPLPVCPGYEVSGTVDATGPGPSRFEEGDAVLALTRLGGYSTHVVVREKQVLARPCEMSPEEGAALLVNALTAFQSMIVMGGLRRAEELGGKATQVLVHGASGGVGTAASDLGQIYGAELFGTASSSKHRYLDARGYDHAFDSRTDGWIEGVLHYTQGRGVDLVLDPIGGAHWADSLRVLAPTGRLVLCGFSTLVDRHPLQWWRALLGVPWWQMSPFSLLNANIGVIGVNMARLWDAAEPDVVLWARKLLRYYRQGELQPHVHRRFPLGEAAAAHAYLEGRRSVGKVVLVS